MNSMGGLCQSGRKPGKPLPEKEAVDYYEAEAVTEWRNEDQNKLAFRNTLNYLTCDADAEISDPAVHHEGRKVFLRGIVVETPKLENPSSLSLEALHDALHWTPHRLVPNKDCAIEQDDFFGQFKNDGSWRQHGSV